MNNKISKEDILKEVFNISVGKSASILSEIIDKKILLNVPDIKLLKLENSKSELKNYISNVIEGSVMVSSICFKDELAGKASLIFPADKMRHFINLCTDENEESECSDLNFTDVDFDIIKEIGNIVLNSIIGEIGNYVSMKVSYKLPEIKVFKDTDIEKIMENEEYTHVLMLYITFNIEHSQIDGAIIINLSLKSLDEILKKIYMMEDDLSE